MDVMQAPIPNYINPPTRKYIILNVHIILLSISFILVGCRIFIRLKLKKTGVDDILIVISWILVLAISICVCLSTNYGFGRHMWDIPAEWFPTGGKLTYAYILFYDPSVILIKCSILTFYLRLAPYPHTVFRATCYTTIIYTVLSGTSFFIVNIFGCTPISAAWDLSVLPVSRCVDKYVLYIVGGANNILTDIFLLFLPIPVLMELTLSLRKKLGMIALFLTGFLTTVVGIIRLKTLVDGRSYSWDAAYSMTWTSVELNVGIMTACMPAVKMFVVWLFPGIEGLEVVREEEEIEIVTIGGSGSEERRRPMMYSGLDSLTGDEGSKECIVRSGIGGDTKLEILGGGV